MGAETFCSDHSPAMQISNHHGAYLTLYDTSSQIDETGKTPNTAEAENYKWLNIFESFLI